jgi:hypothetical protein
MIEAWWRNINGSSSTRWTASPRSPRLVAFYVDERVLPAS